MLDLHTHSSASDGSDSPSMLVENAVKAGLAAIALTDHDTVSGLAEFTQAAEEKGICGIPGVELSSRGDNRELHIVGLFIDPETPSLLSFLEKMRENRNRRNELILAKFNAIGYPVSMEELREAAGGESIGRPHFAAVLVKKGYFRNMHEVFEQCLKRGKRAYAPRELPSPEEAIQAIHEAGGLAVWAHPVSHNIGGSGRAHVKHCLSRLIPAGLDGVEVYYSQFTPAQQQMILELAGLHHLLASGGSDYHGKNIPEIRLGTGTGTLCVPDEILPVLEEEWKRRTEAARS